MGRFNLFVEKGVVEAGGSRIGGTASVENRIASRPVDRGEAHRARLATGIDVAAAKLKTSERSTRIANCYNLAMRRRVVGCRDKISAGCNDLRRRAQ